METVINFFKAINSIEGVALVFSGIAIIISLAQFLSERNRSRKEATIHAFDELEEHVFSKKHYKSLATMTGEEYALLDKANNDKEGWNEATLALSRIEHFAVSVNSKIYDLKTLNRMAGGFLLGEFKRWKPIIEAKRSQSPGTKHYDEFEALCDSLEKLRNKTGSSRKFSWQWLSVCLLSFVLATFVYWLPYLSSSVYSNEGDTAVNILISMASSGIVVFIYRLPKIQQLQNRKLKNVCYGAILFSIIINVPLSFLNTSTILEYIMIVITGIGTSGVALLFSIYNTEIDGQAVSPERKSTSDEAENGS